VCPPIDLAAPPNVYFFSVINCERDVGLAWHFLGHYRSLGIPPERMHLLKKHTNESVSLESNANYLACQQLVEHFQIYYTNWYGKYDDALKLHFLRPTARAMGVRKTDWIMHPDQDELHMYPTSLTQFIQDAEQRNFTWTFGYLVDLISVDGSLDHHVVPNKPLIEQFPLYCRVTSSILGAATQKLLVWRPSLSSANGGFHFINTWVPNAVGQMGGGGYPVLHIKWFAGVAESFINMRVDSLWAPESARLVEYLAKNNNKIDVTQPGLCVSHQQFWQKALTKPLSDFSVPMQILAEDGGVPYRIPS
jgi:hypothetical protein